jgi:hypothetical protein
MLVELYLHSPIRLYGVVLNKRRNYLPFTITLYELVFESVKWSVQTSHYLAE